MARVHVSIGSNIDRATHIRFGVARLRSIYRSVMVSSVYETKAVGFMGDEFYNLAASFETDKDVRQVAAELREIELAAGRGRSSERFVSRTLDLDLLLYDDLIMDKDGIKLPRDEILQYGFVLGPLVEIAPDEHHPVSGMRLGDIWDDFDMKGESLIPIEFDWQSDLEPDVRNQP